MGPDVAIADTQVIDSIRVFSLKTPILGVVQVIDFPRVFILAFFVCLGDNSLMGWEIGPPHKEGRNRKMSYEKTVGLTLKNRRAQISIERDVIKNLLDDQRKIRAAIKQARLNIKMHQEVIADERKWTRIVKQEERTLRLAKRNEKRFAQIAKMEAKLAALKAAA